MRCEPLAHASLTSTIAACACHSVSCFSSSAATLAEWVFTVLIKAPLLILLSAVSLLQLRGILQFIAAAAAKQAAKNQVGDLLRPYLRELAPVLTGVFGKADALSFNLTHVLLTAVLLAVLINGGGFVSALAAPLQRQAREMREQVRETRALGHTQPQPSSFRCALAHRSVSTHRDCRGCLLFSAVSLEPRPIKGSQHRHRPSTQPQDDMSAPVPASLTHCHHAPLRLQIALALAPN